MDEVQRGAVNAILSGKNILLTGAAGTGKTYTLRAATDKIRHGVAMTSMTGVSAILLGGRTLHSFLGIGLAKSEEEVVTGICRRAKAIGKYKTIVIDEIGMLSADMFRWIDRGLCTALGGDLFGNRQMILCGDLFQLGPVSGDWFFKSEAWSSNARRFDVYDLSRVYRHSDPFLGEMLLRVRGGDAEAVRQIADRCSAKLPSREGVVSTRMFAVNRSVDMINQKRYDALQSAERVYKAQDHVVGRLGIHDTKVMDATVPQEMRLKLGTQVMITRNIDLESQICNGTKGVIVDMADDAIYIQTVDGRRIRVGRHDTEMNFTDRFPKTFLRRSQFPLRRAWAATIHKCQGATIDYVSVSLRDCFTPGQIYTALSRVRTASGLYIAELPSDPKWVDRLADPDVVAFYRGFGGVHDRKRDGTLDKFFTRH